MIISNGTDTKFTGDAKQLSIEITSIIAGFKQTLEKEFDMNEEQTKKVICEYARIGLMNNWERKEYLDKISQLG